MIITIGVYYSTVKIMGNKTSVIRIISVLNDITSLLMQALTV